jgi:hypothetical protein
LIASEMFTVMAACGGSLAGVHDQVGQ